MKKIDPKVDSIATYRITVQGTLGEQWSANVHGLVIRDKKTADDELPVTVLTGPLPNQDALKQVLNGLYDQRLPYLSLEYLEEEESQSWQAHNDEDYL